MSKTILAVDDSPSIRQMVAFTLKGAGYNVVEAEDGQAGLDKAKSSAVNLVLRSILSTVLRLACCWSCAVGAVLRTSTSSLKIV